MIPLTREGALQSIEAEVRKERASALGRVGGILEALIDEAEALKTRWAAAPERERPALEAAFTQVVERARTYRWYLEVQREAMGLHQHQEVERQYPIPRLR